MVTFLTIVRYKKWQLYFALCAMALHRIPLLFRSSVTFHKTLGCGIGDSFSQKADWQQFGLLVIDRRTELFFKSTDLSKQLIHKTIYGRFIAGWWAIFGCETYTLLLQPIEGRGSWDGKKAFGELPAKSDYEGPIGVLTRATIRSEKSRRFWEHVEAVSDTMRKAPGYLFSVGIGETPWLRQATFSVWNSKAEMKQFAYQTHQHADVVVKTRKEDWYKEDMFVRFRVLKRWGTLKTNDPLQKLFEERSE